ncbi:unnamed protein product [Pedinophyceae sp. YPF-701]|nr:unnamed protein product [Pedinophyceae sp. YPF-701]
MGACGACTPRTPTMASVHWMISFKWRAHGAGRPSRAAQLPPRRSRFHRCPQTCAASRRRSLSAAASPQRIDASASSDGEIEPVTLFDAETSSEIATSWQKLMRWSRVKTQQDRNTVLEATTKIAVLGGGSFGTAMAAMLAKKKAALEVAVLVRDDASCEDINERHANSKYFPGFELPRNVRATTHAEDAIGGAQFVVHAVPVQHTRVFLEKLRDVIPPDVPLIVLSKGLEVATGLTLADVVPQALGRDQPACFLSGPSFAREILEGRPTAVSVASKDQALVTRVRRLLSGPVFRMSYTNDVVGIEIAGALKNVLAIAAGICDGLEVGRNATAAIVAQGTCEIRWLAVRMGAAPETMSGLSGLGDIMLTCYGSLSRNRTVGERLGRGETLQEIVESSSQVAEGVATAAAVVSLARKYKVQLPVLTAVASILNGDLKPSEALELLMVLPAQPDA